MSCPLCNSDNLQSIYSTEDIPIFQNKVYQSKESAKNAPLGKVNLTTCQECQFTFNSCFNQDIMHYDKNYQNEQALSAVFDDYLNNLVRFFIKNNFRNKKIIEIGCGKGSFLKKLWAKSFDAIGFDKAYEGNDPRIIKDYFSKQHANAEVDLIILRHTLEHIHDPLDFLLGIAEIIDYKGKVYIEVPSFEWILENKAYWDIFYEHCNYFTQSSLKGLFKTAESGLLFSGQYMYVLADLSELRDKATKNSTPLITDIHSLHKHAENAKNFIKNHRGILVWGAGAKGSTFVNITDPNSKYISKVIDINPKKSNRYIAKSSHQIVSPESLDKQEKVEILIMNENYLNEIISSNEGSPYTFYTLGADEFNC